MCTLPSIWPSTSTGLTALPTSCTATTRSIAPALAIDHHHLRGVREARVDRRVRMLGIAEVVGPVDDVLAVVVDVGRAVGGECRAARRVAPNRRSSACRAIRWSARTRARGWCRRSRRSGRGRCRAPAAATWRATVWTPWPISVQPWRTSTRSLSRAEPHDRPAHLAEPVAEPRVLEPEPEPDRLAVGDRRLVVGADLVEARPRRRRRRRP